MKWDIMDIALPWRYFIGESLNNGQLPFWNPHNNLGFPQMGDPSTWYPITWILSIFGRYTVFDVQLEYLIHLFVGGFGFYSLGKKLNKTTENLDHASLVGALYYSLSGFMIGNAQHLGWIISAAWIPWVMNSFFEHQRSSSLRSGLYLALSLFLLLTGGYPGLFIITVYVLVGLFLGPIFKNGIKRLKPQLVLKYTIPLAAFLLMSAVVLLCAFEMRPLVNRGTALLADASRYGVLSGSWPVQAIQTLLVPGLIKSGSVSWGQDLSMLSVYLGVIPLIAVLAGLFSGPKRESIRFWFLLGFVFLLISMGESLPLRKWLYFLLPGFDLFRFPSIFRLFFILFTLLAAVLSLGVMINSSETQKIMGVRWAFLVIPITLVLFFVGTPGTLNFQFKDIIKLDFFSFESIADPWDWIVFHGTIMVAVGATFVWLIEQQKLKARLILLPLVVLELFFVTQSASPISVIDSSEPQRLEKYLNDAPVSELVGLTDQELYRSDDTTFKEVPYLWKNLATYEKRISGDGVSPYGLNTLQLSKEKGEYDVLLNNPPVHLLEKGEITRISYSETVLSLELNTEVPNRIVFAQNNYPNWRVSINGEEQMPETYASTAISSSISQGVSEVQFYLDLRRERVAFWVSAFSLLLVLVLLAYFEWRVAISRKGSS